MQQREAPSLFLPTLSVLPHSLCGGHSRGALETGVRQSPSCDSCNTSRERGITRGTIKALVVFRSGQMRCMLEHVLTLLDYSEPSEE